MEFSRRLVQEVFAFVIGSERFIILMFLCHVEIFIPRFLNVNIHRDYLNFAGSINLKLLGVILNKLRKSMKTTLEDKTLFLQFFS